MPEPISPQDLLKDRLDILPEDGALLAKIKQWENDSKPYSEELKKVQSITEQYYLGNQTDKAAVPQYLSNIVQNRIFEAVETAVPIITSQPAQFVIMADENSEVAMVRKQKVQKVLNNFYQIRDLAALMEMCVRHLIMYRFGVAHVFWNEDIDDIDVEYIRPQQILIPKLGVVGRKLPYIIRKHDMIYQEIVDFFGEEKANKLLNEQTREDAEQTDKQTKTWMIMEVATDWWTAWKCNDTILKKETNPYYDFENTENNHLEAPHKMYVFVTEFSLGKTPVGETSLVEQAIPIQDAINVLDRMILNNATRMGNGAWLVDSTAMTKEEADQITNEPGLVVYGSGVANANFVRRDSPPALPAYIFNMLSQMEKSFDDVFGLHSTTRGEREPGRETFRGRALLKQADIGRLDKVIRGADRAIGEIGNLVMQCMKMFYDEPRDIKILSSKDAEEVIESFSADDIASGMKAFVTPGSTLPQDEISNADRAIQLWQFGAIDPISLYRTLKYPDPDKMAEDLVKWKQGTLVKVEQPPQQPTAAVPASGGVPPVAQPGQEIPPEAQKVPLPPLQ